ncbi:MAG: InlB B-repeat-containing protein [Patescibacteria group bacterium]
MNYNLIKRAKFLFLALIIFFPLISVAEDSISNIDIIPDLQISNFNDYTIEANITGAPNNVQLIINNINRDSSPEKGETDFFIDGTPYIHDINKPMEGDETNLWQENEIRPDDIYPEIFFTSSEVTHDNPPQNKDIYRGNHHLFDFNNPLPLGGNSNFFIEFNVDQIANNSSDLDVYLAEKNGTVKDFLDSNWRDVSELVTTFDRNSTSNHTHSENSSHYVVQLSANSDGTIGSKSINVNDGFWIILDSNKSPRKNRGWNLRYHETSIEGCDDFGRWYISGETIQGCPDVHIHTARRGGDSEPADGLEAKIIADYEDGTTIENTKFFSFGTLPLLPPNPASFVSPSSGGVYSGDLEVSWNAAADPNNSDLVYSVYLKDENSKTQMSEEETSLTSVNFDTTTINNGDYTLTGKACKDGTSKDYTSSDYCTDFSLADSFTIDNSSDIFSLSNITFTSTNNNSNFAKEGDEVQISFDASGEIINPEVYFFAGGIEMVQFTATDVDGDGSYNYELSHTISSGNPEGNFDYEIRGDNLDKIYSLEEDSGEELRIDITQPQIISKSPSEDKESSIENIDLIIETNKSSSCRYSEIQTESFSEMNEFATTGNIEHQQSIPVESGSSYNYYFLCQDEAGNESNREEISFSVASKKYDLNITKDGNGEGVILSNPAGINCGSQCRFEFTEGEKVILTAEEDSGSNFEEWTGACSGSDDCVLNLNKSEEVIARFDIRPKTSSRSSSSQRPQRKYNQKDISNIRNELTAVQDKLESLKAFINGFNVNVSANLQNTESTTNNSCLEFNKDLSKGLVDDEVKCLQEFLNRNGFTVAESGPGSVGNETRLFGDLTERAVIRFQNNYKTEILDPIQLSEGTGFVGLQTRKKINMLIN